MKPNRLSGHALRNEGKPFDDSGRLIDGSWHGRGKCTCGALSPRLNSNNLRKQWHRDHKERVRRGGTGAVW